MGGSVRDSLFTACTATSASGGVRCNGGGTVQNCSIIRSGGTVNSVGSINGGSKWMSVWTNSTSAAGFVLWASDLDN
jgi:hypothetical protein